MSMTSRFRNVQGNWQAGLPQNSVQWISVILCLIQFFRGLDYAFSNTGFDTMAVAVVENSMPIRVWGWLCMTSSIIMFIGFILHRYTPIIAGAFLAGSSYLSVASGTFFEIVAGGWPWSGYRTPALFFGIAVIWFIGGLGTLAMQRKRLVRSKEWAKL